MSVYAYAFSQNLLNRIYFRLQDNKEYDLGEFPLDQIFKHLRYDIIKVSDTLQISKTGTN